MTVAVTETELRELIERAAFARHYAVQLHDFKPGECTVRVPFQADLERPGGIVAGPVFMAVADITMWLAIATRLGARDESVTTELNTTFLSPARREDFLCVATILKLGRRMIYGVARCVSLQERLLTHHTVTYARPDA